MTLLDHLPSVARARLLPLLVAALALFPACAEPAVPPPVTPLAAPPLAPRADDVVFCIETGSRFGSPECLIPLDAETASHRESSFRFRSAGALFARRERINGSGELIQDERGVATVEYVYQGDHVKVAISRGRSGVERHRQAFGEGGRTVDYTDARGNLRPAGSWNKVVRSSTERDHDGRTVSEQFFDAGSAPARGSDGGYGHRYERDPIRGLVLRTTLLDARGEAMLGTDGYASLAVERDARGLVVVESYLGLHGEPVTTTLGYAVARTAHNRWGNVVERQTFDADGKPALASTSGALVRYRYDEHGNRIETLYVGIDGRPMAGREEWAHRSLLFDKKGRWVEAHFEGAGGPLRNVAPLQRATYDELGRIAEVSRFDDHGAPWLPTPARVLYRHDDRDNVVEERYLDGAGRPRKGLECAEIRRNAFDEQNQVVETSYFDAAGDLVSNCGGYARIVTRYDALGEVVSTAHFDAAGTPVVVMGSRFVFVAIRGPKGAADGPPRTRDEALARAEEVRQKLASGAPFESVYRLYSEERGTLRGISRHMMAVSRMFPEEAAAVPGLAVGQASRPIESAGGFYVFERVR